MRLLQESYEALGRYLGELRAGAPGASASPGHADARAEELERIGDLRMRLEPALGAGAGEVVCPACGRVYHQHPADAEANVRADACEACLAEGGTPRFGAALLADRLPWYANFYPVVLTLCRECRTNVTAGDAGETGTLACSGCRERSRREGGETP